MGRDHTLFALVDGKVELRRQGRREPPDRNVTPSDGRCSRRAGHTKPRPRRGFVVLRGHRLPPSLISIHMKFVDEATIDVAAGNGGAGCVELPAREVHPVRRAQRRRRRPRRQRLGGRRPQPQHADRLPLRAPPRGAQRRARPRLRPVRRGGRRHRAAHAGGHDHQAMPRPAQVLAELLVPDEKVLLAKGGDGGFGNLHFKTSTNRAPRQKTAIRTSRDDNGNPPPPPPSPLPLIACSFAVMLTTSASARASIPAATRAGRFLRITR